VVAPLINALHLEGYRNFLPPCYCEDVDEYGGLQYGTCASRTNCTGGCPWSEEMLKVMGRHDGVAYSIADSFHPVTEEHPSCHLPHVHGDADPDANPGGPSLKDPPLCDGAPCALNVTTVTQAVYLSGSTDDLWRIHLDLPWADTGFLPVSARELKMKLKSRQALWQAAGVLGPDAPLDATDALDRCREINQKAIDWALARASESARRRLNATGKTIATGADAGTCAAGPCWIWDPLRWAEDATGVVIRSVTFATENKNDLGPCGEDKLIPCAAGMHYCKGVSPARVLEWIYTDSLRNATSSSWHLSSVA